MALNDFPRPSTALRARFDEVANAYSASCIFADVMKRDNVMHSGMKPIFRGKVTGPALTVKLAKGDLQDPLIALHAAKPGDAVVIDAGGDTEVSVFGGLMGSLFKQRGVRGAIAADACRDIDELRDLQFLLFSRAVTARGTHTMFSNRKDDVELDVPIVCGGVTVRPGNIIVADEIGVAVVPSADAERVVQLAAEQAEREEKTRRRIAEGRTFEQLLEEFGRI